MKILFFLVILLSSNAFGALGNVVTTIKEVYVYNGEVRLDLATHVEGPHCAPSWTSSVAFEYNSNSPKENEAFYSAALTALAAKKTVYLEYDSVACVMGKPQLRGFMIKSEPAT